MITVFVRTALSFLFNVSRLLSKNVQLYLLVEKATKETYFPILLEHVDPLSISLKFPY